MATPTPGGTTPAAQPTTSVATPHPTVTSAMSQNGFSQNVSPMPNFNFNQLPKVISSTNQTNSSIFNLLTNRCSKQNIQLLSNRQKAIDSSWCDNLRIYIEKVLYRFSRHSIRISESLVQVQVHHCQNVHRPSNKFRLNNIISNNHSNGMLCN